MITATVNTPSREAGHSIASHPWIGRTLGGRYEIDRYCASGGMGSVFVGRHIDLGHEVAIKVLHPHLAEEASAARRFVHEAKVCAGLHHPNVVTTVDFGRADDGVPYIVMEYLVGQTLSQLLERAATLPVPVALELTRQLLAGVAAIHKAGILHRDIKPSNIFLIRLSDAHFHVKLVDFGVAKTASIDVTRDGAFVGTPAYMAPEILFGTSSFTPSADLYSIGLVLHRMVTGTLPFESADPSHMARMKLAGDLQLFANSQQDVPCEVQELVFELLQASASERPQDAQALLPRLERIQRRVREKTGSTYMCGQATEEGDLEARELSAYLETITETQIDRSAEPEAPTQLLSHHRRRRGASVWRWQIVATALSVVVAIGIAGLFLASLGDSSSELPTTETPIRTGPGESAEQVEPQSVFQPPFGVRSPAPLRYEPTVKREAARQAIAPEVASEAKPTRPNEDALNTQENVGGEASSSAARMGSRRARTRAVRRMSPSKRKKREPTERVPKSLPERPALQLRDSL